MRRMRRGALRIMLRIKMMRKRMRMVLPYMKSYMKNCMACQPRESVLLVRGQVRLHQLNWSNLLMENWSMTLTMMMAFRWDSLLGSPPGTLQAHTRTKSHAWPT
jgi:hypothetical protein